MTTSVMQARRITSVREDRISQPHNNRKSGEVKLPPPEYQVMVAGTDEEGRQDIEAI